MTSVDGHKQAILDMLSPGRHHKSGVQDILAMPEIVATNI
ncbi:MAG: hypothetical protein ACI9CO_000984 [Candidatus Azotimanducaceae bacterium]|jgi:hypothetical protein